MKSVENWFYDEMVHVGTDYNNLEEVKNYDDRMSKFRNFKNEALEILKELDIQAHYNILEMGAGTGEISIELSGHCGSVIAVDISSVMLEHAKNKAKSRGRANIDFIRSGFLNYDHSREPLDAVISQIALHHLPDFWKPIALMNIFKMLKKGGKFFLRDIVFSINTEKYVNSINHTLNSFGETAGDVFKKQFENHIKSEFSTYDWIMEEMLYRAGFDIKKAEYRDFFMAVYVCEK